MRGLSILSMRSAAMGVAIAVAGAMTAQAGDIKGVVSFEGERPRPKNIAKRFEADAVCAKLHMDPATGKMKQIRNEDVIVSRDLKVKNVFVYIKSGVSGKHAPPAEPAVIDQKGCQYHPHVQGMIAGQKLKIISSDPTVHNIHSLPKKNREINIGQPKPGETIVDVMKRAEMPVKFKCDVHPWMAAFIFVMDHPYFAVTNSKGEFTITGVPDGEYEVAAWHEVYGEVTAKLTVGGGDASQDFALKEKTKK